MALRTFQKSIYWTIVTITTVGYGDVVPITAIGRSLAALLMILVTQLLHSQQELFPLRSQKKLEQQKVI